MDELIIFLKTLYSNNPILLAGSYSIGNQTADSDVDLLIFTDDVLVPVITYREIQGYKIEAIEIPKKNALYYLERTAHDSGAYIFMLAMGKIVRDQDHYLANLKSWGEKRFLAGPPKEKKHYKVNRMVTDITNLITDLEGDKIAIEKSLIVNNLLRDLFNLLFIINDLWPMNGKWVYRKLNPIYPNLLDQLFSDLKASLGTTDYDKMVSTIDELIKPIGGRLKEYSSTISGDHQLQSDTLQIMIPGVTLSDLAPKAFAEFQKLKNEYPRLYLKDFEEGGVGIAIPEIKQKVAPIFTAIESISPRGNARFSYEPILKNLYGGNEFHDITEKYFSLVTHTIIKIYNQPGPRPGVEDLLEFCAYLFPIFCSSIGIPTLDLPRFSNYLINKWIIEAADPYNESNALHRHQLVVQLEKQLTERVENSDPEFKEILLAILFDNSLRFDNHLYDSWADGLNNISRELNQKVKKHSVPTSKFQLIAIFNEVELPEGAVLWPVYEQYLSFLFNVLDIQKKDRLYFVSLVQDAQFAD